MTIRKTEYHIEAYDFIVIIMKTAHTYAADNKIPWPIYRIHFKGYSASHIFSLLEQKLGFKSFIRLNEKTIDLFEEMYSQLERGYASDSLLYANMCLGIT